MTIPMDKFHKRLSKKARRGFRGWPVATIAFYGLDLSRVSKVAVGIIRTEGGDAEDLQTWLSDVTDLRRDPMVSQEIYGRTNYRLSPSGGRRLRG
jgi:hypothetical protein